MSRLHIQRIFISHCHHDRAIATDLQRTLDTAGGETFLDQDKMQGGDNLPKRITDGLAWADTVLLIWSVSAAASAWVDWEWNAAYDLRKRIVPYVLDNTPLPAVLDNLIYIPLKDRKLADSSLLITMFGKDFSPDPGTLFPGHWNATINKEGMPTQGEYSLTLRQNGQIEGEVWITKNPPVDEIYKSLGLGAINDMRVRVSGTWSYDCNMQSLKIKMANEEIVIQASGRENHAITGTDYQGRLWKLWRTT